MNIHKAFSTLLDKHTITTPMKTPSGRVYMLVELWAEECGSCIQDPNEYVVTSRGIEFQEGGLFYEVLPEED